MKHNDKLNTMNTKGKNRYNKGEKTLSSVFSRETIWHYICFITTVCMILIMPTITLADDAPTEICANEAGTIIIGNSGYKYCKSNERMNWWNAWAWCDGLRKIIQLG